MTARPSGPPEHPKRLTPAYPPADLTTCEDEPIHRPGAIQPHGVLLAVDRATRRVVVGSGNVAGLFGRPVAEVLGTPFDDLVGPELAGRVRAAEGADNLDEPLHAEVRTGAGVVRADVVLHVSGDRLVVEVEPAPDGGGEVSYRATRAAVGRLAGSVDVTALCGRLAREVRALTGFDRVMVYRFDAQWNGEVVAEDRREDLEPFHGLRYPASDIPAQARRLYTENWTRLIADVGYVPSPLQPLLDPGTGAPLDLSHSVLRSVSPVHLEYLRNMGVAASMSVSLVVEGRLWGLVACHHYSGPHRPSCDARSAAEFLGQTASQLIGERVRSEERDQALAAQELMSDVLAAVSASGREPLATLVGDERLLDLLGAGGAAAWDGHQLRTCGDVPPWEALRRTAHVLRRQDGAATFTDHLSLLDPRLAGVADRAAGALRVGLDGGGWLLWVRPEQVQVVDWGGDPNEAEVVRAEGDGLRIGPRVSFEKWREVVRGRSSPWRPWHGATAERLRSQITGIMLGRSRDQITIAETLQRAIVLDEAPVVPGVAVHSRYRPAAGGQLGGDWWDVLPLDGHRVAFVVGDVAGHGVAAAAAMAQLRTALRAYLLEGHSPASALDRLDALVATLPGGHTATAVVAVLHQAGTGDGTGGGRAVVELAGAGHPAPVLVTGGAGRVLAVPSRPMLGLGFGATSGAADEVVRLPWPEDALLLLYSDGLVERRDADLAETTALLAEVAGRATADLGATRDDGADGTGGAGAGDAVDRRMHALADRLLTAVPGGDQDDTTLVLARPRATSR